jgi:DNA repair exonuclease SbcCD nuclease subunit
MKYPYGIHSDQHAHAWSQFSSIDTDGVNSRLRIILNEIDRAGSTVALAGGDTLIGAGDLFHQRGEIKPSVFNPTIAQFQSHNGRWKDVLIPGNHDLEGKDATTLGNAMQALDALPSCTVCMEPTLVEGAVWVFPWYADLDVLRAEMIKRADPTKDAIIHAPVNGVIKGIPDHGLEAAELAAMGYRRVFSGHYHDHKVMEGGKVISIGATTHQTWSDPGTAAGFILVYEDRIDFRHTQAPRFVDLTEEVIDEADARGLGIPELVDGNYVRIKLTDVTEKEIKSWRDDVMKEGARGCIVLATKKNPATVRTGAASAAAVSLGSSVEHFIRNDMKPLLVEDVSLLAQEVLSEAQS